MAIRRIRALIRVPLRKRDVELKPSRRPTRKCGVHVAPDPAKARRYVSVVRWRCPTAHVIISFNKPEGSPFVGDLFVAPAGAWAVAGVPVQPAGKYRYTVVLFPKNGGKPLICDPQVEVWDPRGGGGGNGRGGRTKLTGQG